MIHYHGTPITPETAAVQILQGRHGLVSFAHPNQITSVAEVCHSFVLDSGAYTFWKGGQQVDSTKYYRFVDDWRRHPGFDWALITDIIDGSEEENNRLIAEWPFQTAGVPVWHLHESLGRLASLVVDWPRVAFGSSGAYATVGTSQWWGRMVQAMDVSCDSQGRPEAKFHGLRMLNPRIFSRLPFASADSCNIARNIGIDKHWTKGSYLPPTKAARGVVMAERIESHNSAPTWIKET